MLLQFAERELNSIITSAKVAIAAQVAKRKADQEALAEKQKGEKATQFQGYIDTTGVLFKRPGTHKLIMGGRIVCFLRVKDGDEKIAPSYRSTNGRRNDQTWAFGRERSMWHLHSQ